jgi:hypothetical protein
LNETILNTEIQEFIKTNLNSDVSMLLLKGMPFSSSDSKDIIEQIEAKKRCEKKLPSWYNTQNIYYPNKLNIEQTSSEITAAYKSHLVSGESIIDLTGGFGVDCLYFSKTFKTVEHCEINERLSKLVTHNYTQLGIQNIKTKNIDGIEHLKNTDVKYDWIYIDPSRRHDSKGKVFFLNDCLPNVPEHINLLFQHSKNILIKTSPLLDFSIGLQELNHVKTIHAIAINNEVKELLWVLEADFKGAITIETVNLKNENTDYFSFFHKNERDLESRLSLPLSFLYEPNAAILKAGGFHSISSQLHIYKLHKHSHLYTNDTLIDFPGRCFKIEQVLSYNKKALKKTGITKANVTTRNFPETVQQIRKKFNLKDGGNTYLFFTTDKTKNKIIIICSKLQT